MELRQLRYFVTLAEELHFGRAAAREHIVQSALSQQIRRLERELKVVLVERTTHRVELTAAGRTLASESRRILALVDQLTVSARAVDVACRMKIRAGVDDSSFDALPRIMAEVRDHHPRFTVVHYQEAGVPDQYRMLLDGKLDVGIGRVVHAPDGIASELVRCDRLGVLVCEDHVLAARSTVPVADLAAYPLLFADDSRAPEANQFVRELCRTVGFVPQTYPGTACSVYGSRPHLRTFPTVLCVPESCGPIPGLCWRPLTEPASYYPWSLLWRAGEETEIVRAVRCCARRLGRQRRWLGPSMITFGEEHS